MNSPIIQLLVLAGIAVFLILRLRSVLGTRDGFEKPAEPRPLERRSGPDLSVIDGTPDPDITDHVKAESAAAKALAAMKRKEPDFNVGDFVHGAGAAYEMILMAFERGDLSQVKPFLDPEIYDAFAAVVEDRHQKGLTVEAKFVGLSQIEIDEALFDEATGEADISVRFQGELTYQVRDKSGEVVEGNDTSVKRQKDVWTFSRQLGTNDPNWLLVATGE